MELTKEQFLHDFKDILHEEQLIKVEDATPVELFQTLARTIRNTSLLCGWSDETN